MALRKSVTLYYDVMCPYSWIAFEQLCRYRADWEVDVTWKPFSLAHVFMAHNNGHQGKIPAKFSHMCEDAETQGHYYGVPIRTPTNTHDKMYTRGSLPAMRLLTAVQLTQPELTENLSRSLWSRMWAKDQDITHRESLIQAGRDIGLTTSHMEYFLTKIREKSTANHLKENTSDALKAGAFGAPTIIVDDTNNTHLIFGSDRMHIVAKLLGKPISGVEGQRDLLKSKRDRCSTADGRAAASS